MAHLMSNLLKTPAIVFLNWGILKWFASFKNDFRMIAERTFLSKWGVLRISLNEVWGRGKEIGSGINASENTQGFI